MVFPESGRYTFENAIACLSFSRIIENDRQDGQSLEMSKLVNDGITEVVSWMGLV